MAKEKARFVAGKWKEETEDRRAAKQEEEHIQEELKEAGLEGCLPLLGHACGRTGDGGM